MFIVLEILANAADKRIWEVCISIKKNTNLSIFKCITVHLENLKEPIEI